MQLSQKKFTNKTNFEFGDDTLKYTIKDKSGSRTFSVEYAAILTDSGEVEERNDWYRNVGFFWILVGGYQIFSRYSATGDLRGSMWLTLGAICFALYWILRTDYTTFDSEKGRIFVIKDDTHDEILEAIDARRKQQWFQWYGTIDFENDPGKEIGKFQWLLDRKAISEEDFLETKNKIIEFHGLVAQQAPTDDRTLN